MRRSTQFGALALTVGLLLGACGGSETSSAPTSTEETDTTAPAAPATTAPLPGLVAPTVDGGQIDFASLEGQDVVLWFWAPW